MVVYDKKLPYINKSKRFFRKLMESRTFYDKNGRLNYISRTNLFETDHLTDPIVDSPNELARFFKRFLAEIGKQIEI